MGQFVYKRNPTYAPPLNQYQLKKFKFNRTLSVADTIKELISRKHLTVNGNNVKVSDLTKEYVENLFVKMPLSDFLLIEAYFADEWKSLIDYQHLID